MPLAIIPDVRSLGGLPEAVEDAVIKPHLESAARRIKKIIGDYEAVDAVAEDEDAIIEAEACMTMYLLLPVLHTFYTQGLPGMQKELGDMEFLFHNPDQMFQVRQNWHDRAVEAVRPSPPDAWEVI